MKLQTEYALVGQFLLTDKESALIPENWCSACIGRWTLWHDSLLPVITLTTVDNIPFGWILGHAITDRGRLIDQMDSVLSEKDVTDLERLENFIYSLGGRFAVAIVGLGVNRFYLDPFGSLSAIYCHHQHLVASTPVLIPKDDETADRTRLARAIGIPFTNGMYPLGLTPRHGIERILPNHFLDLSSWRTIRHWPKAILAEDVTVDQAISEIAAIVKRQISAIVSHSPTRLALTAGRDSRMLLACARENQTEIEFFTVDAGDAGSRLDCDIAKKISKHLNLNYKILEKENAIQTDLDEWMYRIGYSTGEVVGLNCATQYKRFGGSNHIVLKGCGGGVERASFWYYDDAETSTIPAERIATHCRCPAFEEVLARARDWLVTVPVANSLQLLDLFYIEQRLGCWAGVWPYAECEAGVNIFPMCHRVVIDRMLRLPSDYRRSKRLMKDIIGHEWPELLQWPINSATGADFWLNRMRDLKHKGSFALTQPAWVLGRCLDTLLRRPQWQRRRVPARR